MTAGAALASAASLLGTRLDAELLLAHVLDVSRSNVVARDERELTPEEQGDFEQLLARRRAGEPLAYLMGTKEFWSLELEVTKDVLVPRPETELLVEWALELPFAPSSREAAYRGAILDIGTGSGAIALALAKELPGARVAGVDVSDRALAVAKRNAQRLGLHATFTHANLFDLRRHDGAPFDLVVSNPPYVADGDPHLVELKFEPLLALTSGRDGLDALRAIASGARALLRDGGWLLVEHGATQGPAVRQLLEAAKLEAIETRRDLAGHERATGGRKPVSSRA